MKREIYLLLLILVSVSCTGKKQSDATNTEPDATAISITSLEQQLVQTDNPLEKYILLDKIAKEKAQTLSPDEFGSYFQEFKSQAESIMGEINTTEADYLYQRHSFLYDLHGNEKTPPEWVLEKEKRYADAGLQFVHIGEGMEEIYPPKDYYSKNFYQFLPQDVVDFLKLTENEGEIIVDAGVWVEAEELSKIILDYEYFIKNHPDSKFVPEAKELYHKYQTTYLIGIDNWPRMSKNSGLLPEAKTELQRFINAHPDSKTAELAKEILDVEETDFYALYQWIIEKQK